MARAGWTVPDWPKEYGGGGLSPAETKILKEEMARDRLPAAADQLRHLDARPGAAQIRHRGAEEALPDRDRPRRDPLVPGLFRAGRGSDLAGLQTKAEDKGDHYLVNGQKVWTSYADKADWIFCLVRTSTESKHGGISFLLFDMESPGVSTKPILLITGNSPFCETFFDDVKVPKDQLVGEVNKGWDVAKYLLGHEREMISGMGLGGASAALGQGARADRRRSAAPRRDRRVRRRRARVRGDERAVHRPVEGRRSASGHAVDDEICRHRAQQAPPRAGHGRGRQRRARMGQRTVEGGKAARDWLRTKANSIEGGTSEIQLGIVAKHILRLPGA